MSETLDQLTATSMESQEQAVELMEKLLAVAQPSAVFGEPVVAEGRTIITAAEVNVGLGVGFGVGGGTAPSREGKERKKDVRRHHQRSADPHERVELEGAEAEAEETEETEPPVAGADAGMGGGGGGGGGASGRPVAVISVSEEGVHVEPVVDATKIALAFFTALGSMAFMLLKMRKAADR